MSRGKFEARFHIDEGDLEKARALAAKAGVSTAEIMRQVTAQGLPVVEQMVATAKAWEAEQAAKLRGFKL